MSRSPKSGGEIIMAKEKKQRVLACPPREFEWIENLGELEKLSEIYAKLSAICDFFSTFKNPSMERPAMASDLYGYWFFFRDICTELSDVLKIDHWTGEIGKKRTDEGEES